MENWGGQYAEVIFIEKDEQGSVIAPFQGALFQGTGTKFASLSVELMARNCCWVNKF